MGQNSPITRSLNISSFLHLQPSMGATTVKIWFLLKSTFQTSKTLFSVVLEDVFGSEFFRREYQLWGLSGVLRVSLIAQQAMYYSMFRHNLSLATGIILKTQIKFKLCEKRPILILLYLHIDYNTLMYITYRYYLSSNIQSSNRVKNSFTITS